MIGQQSRAAAEGTSGSVRRPELGGSAAEWVINDLTARATARGAVRRSRHRNYERLERPNPASIKILSQRATPDRCSAAVAVDDCDGKGYIVIGVFAKDGEELRPKGSCEGPDRDVPGRQGPYLGLSAWAGGHFFAGGRLQSAGLPIARVRLIWEDGYELHDTVENGIAMFLV